MQIREMQICDYQEVYALWENTSGMGLNDIDDSQSGIEKYLLRNPTTCFIAEEKGSIIGSILSGHDGRRGFIYHTAVSVSQRGRGVGSTLVNHVMEALKKEGINKVALVTFSNNLKGNTFWENRGFLIRNDLNYRNKVINNVKRIDT
jgi:Acetyltransferases